MKSPGPNLMGFAMATRKPPPPGLSMDITTACCQVLASLSDGECPPADAIDYLAEFNRALIDSPDATIVDSLSRQAHLLEQLWLHYAARAARETRPEHSATLSKAALNCQAALTRALGAIYQMSKDAKEIKALVAPEVSEVADA